MEQLVDKLDTPDKAIEGVVAALLLPLHELLARARNNIRIGLSAIVLLSVLSFGFILVLVFVDRSVETMVAGAGAIGAACGGLWLFALRVRREFRERARETLFKCTFSFSELRHRIVQTNLRIREIRFRSRKQIEETPTDVLRDLTDSLIKDSLTYIDARKQVDTLVVGFEASFSRFAAATSARTLVVILASTFVALQGFDLVLSFLQYSRVEFEYPNKTAITSVDHGLLGVMHILLYVVPALLVVLILAFGLYVAFGRYLLDFLLSSLSDLRRDAMQGTLSDFAMMGEVTEVIRALVMEILALESMLRGAPLPGRS